MSETAAIVKQELNGLAAGTSSRAIILNTALDADTEQRVLLTKYIEKHMKDGTDFGVIPGTKNPSLLKPGAEKLVDLYRCTPKFKLMKSEEDFDKGFFNYMFRVQLVSRDSTFVLAEGYGSCNSREGRYRWRNSNRKCPTCGKETIIKGDAKYGGGWVCWKKKDGCGAKFDDGAAAIESQPSGKVENDDIATMANTVLKMAKKRALVDGAIALARCSDMFTQDVEDFAEAPEAAKPAAPSIAGAAALKAKVMAAAPKASPPRPSRMQIQEQPPPPSDEDAPWSNEHVDAAPAEAAYQPDPPMSFGSGKGKPLSELTGKDLAWYAKCLSENVENPDKANFRAKNEAALASIVREQKRR